MSKLVIIILIIVWGICCFLSLAPGVQASLWAARRRRREEARSTRLRIRKMSSARLLKALKHVDRLSTVEWCEMLALKAKRGL